MRLIYVDEAGTGPAEPVRVVASVIIHGDNELRDLEAEINRITLEDVPEAIRGRGFLFHGKEVFNRGKIVELGEWPFSDRVNYFKRILGIPLAFGIPIGLGICFKGHFDNIIPEEFWDRPSVRSAGRHGFEHGVAFSNCMEKSDLFLRKYLDGKEIGTIVAEDVPSNRHFLSRMALFRRGRPLELSSEMLMPTQAQRLLNAQPDLYVATINNIVDVPSFVPKGGAPLLQLADACAFTFRRFLSKQPLGDELILAMLGPAAGENFIREPAWFSGVSSGLFNTRKYWSEDQINEVRERNWRLRNMKAYSQIFSGENQARKTSKP